MTMAEEARITTAFTEWAVQCFTRDGDVHTGAPKASRKKAEESGARLTKINGAEWWLISRRRVVTVETSPWVRISPAICRERHDEETADE